MAKINPGTLHDYKNGEIVTEQILDTDFEIIRTAINDNHDRLEAHKSASVLDHPDGSVTTAKIANGAITGQKIATGAITADKIALGTLDSRYYTEAEIDQKLGQLVVGQIPGNAVVTEVIRDGAVTTPKIADGAVTAAKVSSDIATKTYVQQYVANNANYGMIMLYMPTL
jgi:hypothetical protein